MSRENVEWQSNSSDKHLMCSNGFSLAIAYEYLVNLGNRTYMIYRSNRNTQHPSFDYNLDFALYILYDNLM